MGITVYGNRVQRLWLRHNCDDSLTWYGPDCWRSTGIRWCYEYRLRRMGPARQPADRDRAGKHPRLRRKQNVKKYILGIDIGTSGTKPSSWMTRAASRRQDRRITPWRRPSPAGRSKTPPTGGRLRPSPSARCWKSPRSPAIRSRAWASPARCTAWSPWTRRRGRAPGHPLERPEDRAPVRGDHRDRRRPSGPALLHQQPHAHRLYGGKILWMKEEEPENFARTKVILNPKDYVRYKLTASSPPRSPTPRARACSTSRTAAFRTSSSQSSALRARSP